MSKQKDNVSSLLAAINRQPIAPAAKKEQEPTTPEPQPAPKESHKQSPKPRIAKPSKNKVGQPVQFWLHDDDRQTIRELAAWLAGQGFRTSDSQVIRAVLRLAKTGGPLLDAYRDAAKMDGRRKP